MISFWPIHADSFAWLIRRICFLVVLLKLWDFSQAPNNANEKAWQAVSLYIQYDHIEISLKYFWHLLLNSSVLLVFLFFFSVQPEFFGLGSSREKNQPLPVWAEHNLSLIIQVSAWDQSWQWRGFLWRWFVEVWLGRLCPICNTTWEIQYLPRKTPGLLRSWQEETRRRVACSEISAHQTTFAYCSSFTLWSQMLWSNKTDILVSVELDRSLYSLGSTWSQRLEECTAIEVLWLCLQG